MRHDKLTTDTRVENARSRQRARFAGMEGMYANSDMRIRDIDAFCRLTNDARQLLELSVKRMQLSARAYHRILKLARTIADLADTDIIELPHAAEAIQYRPAASLVGSS